LVDPILLKRNLVVETARCWTFVRHIRAVIIIPTMARRRRALFLLVGCSLAQQQISRRATVFSNVPAFQQQHLGAAPTAGEILVAVFADFFVQPANFMLDHGADVRPVDLGGYSALGNAAGKKHEDIVAILLARGADPNQAIAEAKQDHDNVAVFLIAEARAMARGDGMVLADIKSKPPASTMCLT
jgi:ankyrin repeat protein